MPLESRLDLLRKSNVNLEDALYTTQNLEGSFPLEGEQAVRPYTTTWIDSETSTFAGGQFLIHLEIGKMTKAVRGAIFKSRP